MKKKTPRKPLGKFQDRWETFGKQWRADHGTNTTDNGQVIDWCENRQGGVCCNLCERYITEGPCLPSHCNKTNGPHSLPDQHLFRKLLSTTLRPYTDVQFHILPSVAAFDWNLTGFSQWPQHGMQCAASPMSLFVSSGLVCHNHPTTCCFGRQWTIIPATTGT